MKRLLLIAVALLAVAVPIATAKVVSLGEPTDGSLPPSPCPGKDLAGTENDILCVSPYQMTGYQEVAINAKKRPYVIRRDGRIIAFTVKLGKLTQGQIDFFDNRFNDPASVRISIMRKGKKKPRLHDHRMVAQSEVFSVEEHFGASPTFVLKEPLDVERGNIVALTVPTWAPVLASEQDRSEFWRSSRSRGNCGTAEENAPPSAHMKVGSLRNWRCSYRGERLLYTATYVPDNRTTKPVVPDDTQAGAATGRNRPQELGSLGGGAAAPPPITE